MYGGQLNQILTTVSVMCSKYKEEIITLTQEITILNGRNTITVTVTVYRDSKSHAVYKWIFSSENMACYPMIQSLWG